MKHTRMQMRRFARLRMRLILAERERAEYVRFFNLMARGRMH